MSTRGQRRKASKARRLAREYADTVKDTSGRIEERPREIGSALKPPTQQQYRILGSLGIHGVKTRQQAVKIIRRLEANGTIPPAEQRTQHRPHSAARPRPGQPHQ